MNVKESVSYRSVISQHPSVGKLTPVNIPRSALGSRRDLAARIAKKSGGFRRPILDAEKLILLVRYYRSHSRRGSMHVHGLSRWM
jgi:hypothetical protein